MIRGIPKEGWKLIGMLLRAWCTSVMIRGIPKEGWKPDKPDSQAGAAADG
jgi:hypothetical protein